MCSASSAAARRRRAAHALLAAAALGAAQAELSDEDYRSQAGALPPAQRARVEAELRAQRAAEAEAAAAEAARQQARQAALAAQRAQRPVAEQLLEARCNACHASALVEGSRRGVLGWWWTIQRMRWAHGASVSMTETGQIAAHLAAQQPADAAQIRLEWSIVAAAGVSLSAVAAWALLAGRRRRRSRLRR
jgi:cytochrome c5